jgi:hypothetical protein
MSSDFEMKVPPGHRGCFGGFPGKIPEGILLRRIVFSASGRCDIILLRDSFFKAFINHTVPSGLKS